MIITCPECTTRYLVKAADISEAGRTVRCVKCQHTWHQLPLDDDEHIDVVPPPSSDTPPPSHANVPALPEVPRKRLSTVGYAIAASVLFTIGAATGVAVYKDEIVASWEPAALLYETVGASVPVTGQGLMLSNLSVQPAYTADGEILTVEGQVTNTTARQKKIPSLVFTVRDETRQELAKWVYDIQPAKINPGETLTFATDRPVEGASANNVLVQFQ